MGQSFDKDAILRLYTSTPIETLIRSASRGVPPFNVNPSFRNEAIADAIVRSRQRPQLFTKVRAWSRRHTLGFVTQPIPGSDVLLVGIVSSSENIPVMVANLARALELSGADTEQLVSSLEQRVTEGKSYLHTISAVPGSR